MIALNFPGVNSMQRTNFPFKVYLNVSLMNILKANYNTLDFIL